MLAAPPAVVVDGGDPGRAARTLPDHDAGPLINQRDGGMQAEWTGLIISSVWVIDDGIAVQSKRWHCRQSGQG